MEKKKTNFIYRETAVSNLLAMTPIEKLFPCSNVRAEGGNIDALEDARDKLS